jgi:transaldolase
MKIFLDTADVQAIQSYKATGLIDGVTTNPTLLFRAATDPVKTIHAIQKELPSGLISVEVTETDADKVYTQAHAISRLGKNILVKIPCAFSYYPVIRTLVSEGIALNITLVFSVTQGVLMSKLGVAYISPFVGRLEDAHQDGSALLHALCDAKKRYNFSTNILAASLRNNEHVATAIAAGVDAVTVSPALFESITQSALTDAGITLFMDDWKKLGITQFP